MYTPLCDLPAALPPDFTDKLAIALRVRAPELVLAHAAPCGHALLMTREYLRQLSLQMKNRPEGNVVLVAGLSTPAEIEHALAHCGPGHVVFFDELDARPRGNAHTIKLAERFVSRGATVVGAVQGVDETLAQDRVKFLRTCVAAQGAAPPMRLIAFAPEPAGCPLA